MYSETKFCSRTVAPTRLRSQSSSPLGDEIKKQLVGICVRGFAWRYSTLEAFVVQELALKHISQSMKERSDGT